MASLILYTKLQLIQRIKQHIANGFPDASFSTTDNEVLLYIDQVLASTIVGQVYSAAKVEGNLVMPESYLTTYLLPAPVKSNLTGYWTSTLPQPPLSLPLGYSITRGYFAATAYGVGSDIIWIKSKRVGRRNSMPKQFGVNAWVEGSTVFLEPSNSASLLGANLYVTMAKSRTDSITETLNMPDDAIEIIFNNVVQKLIQRMQLPKDIIQDDLPSGATNISKP